MDTKVRELQSSCNFSNGLILNEIRGLGVVATPTDRVLPAQQSQQDAEAEVVEVIPEEPVKILETQGTFDEMIVWRHEFLPAADDSYVKGVEEWIKFAETV